MGLTIIRNWDRKGVNFFFVFFFGYSTFFWDGIARINQSRLIIVFVCVCVCVCGRCPGKWITIIINEKKKKKNKKKDWLIEDGKERIVFVFKTGSISGVSIVRSIHRWWWRTDDNFKRNWIFLVVIYKYCCF